MSNEFKAILDGHYLEFINKFKDGSLDISDCKVRATVRILKRRGLL
jgi:hypothetical protein